MAFNRDHNNRGSGFRPRSSFGSRPRFGRDRGPIEMHQAICDNCGKECEVPFRPTGGKPVYCSNCFENQKEGSGSGRFDRRSPERSANFESRPAFNAGSKDEFRKLNDKLDKILDLLSPLPQAEKETSQDVAIVSDDKVEKPAKVAPKKALENESPSDTIKN